MSLASLTLERVVTGVGFADVPASPLQRAICRAASGLPLGDIDPELVERHFGCRELPAIKPRRFVLIAGIRGGKSMLSCCAAICGALTADLSTLKPHELPRYAIIAPTVDAARATFVQLTGIVSSSKTLRTFLDGEPTADTLVFRRPDGRRVEIVVVAGQRGGLSVRNRWLAGITIEETASFGSESNGAVVNVEDLLSAAETRLLHGCQAWLISSPYGAVGLLHTLYERHFGKPGETLVVHAPTRALNPSFPQARIDEIRRESPEVAAREYDAEFTSAESGLLSSLSVHRATREGPLELPYERGVEYAAAADAADGGAKGNGFSFCVIAKVKPEPAVKHFGQAWSRNPSDNEPRWRVVLIKEWRGLSPGAVWMEIARVAKRYGICRVRVDQFSAGANADLARMCGLTLHVDRTTATSKLEDFTNFQTLLHAERIELPPDLMLRKDLLGVRKRASANGATIHLPKTADGRHADMAAAVVAALAESRTHVEPKRFVLLGF